MIPWLEEEAQRAKNAHARQSYWKEGVHHVDPQRLLALIRIADLCQDEECNQELIEAVEAAEGVE